MPPSKVAQPGCESLPAAELETLRLSCGGDAARLGRWIKRRLGGEPIAYILGWLEFRGLRFEVDRRVFLTEPENTHLIDAIVEFARARADSPPRRAVEFGTGCGSLAISLLKELPQLEIVGLEINEAALEVARANIARHGARMELLESDLFESWENRPPPDLIFGDPPWGDYTDETDYEGQPEDEHFWQMPALSATPLGSRTAAHREILEAVIQRGWRLDVFLNCGCLPEADIRALGEVAPEYEILHRAVGANVLHCRF